MNISRKIRRTVHVTRMGEKRHAYRDFGGGLRKSEGKKSLGGPI
jgi:hypothetical protein